MGSEPVNDMIIKGPQGQEPNVRIRPLFSHAERVMIHIYVGDVGGVVGWQPNKATYLTGFELEASPGLSVSQITISSIDLLDKPAPVAQLAPRGVLNVEWPDVIQVGTRVEVVFGEFIRCSFPRACP